MGFLSAAGALLKIIATALGWLQQERQTQIGVDLQRGADAETALATVEKMQAAEDAAPKTQADAVSRLMAGWGMTRRWRWSRLGRRFARLHLIPERDVVI